MTTRRRLGVHTSIAGGIHLSVERAMALGCSAMQIFSHNPRQWAVKAIPGDSVSEFKNLRKSYDIDPVFIHASYLINLAASDYGVFERSISLLYQEFELADLMDADYLVLHTGSASPGSEKDARLRVINALALVSTEKKWRAKLLLENTAGERGDMSSSIEDLTNLVNEADQDLIGGLCIDTCHAFASGYDISGQEGLSEFVLEIEKHIGINTVKLIHLNDSRKNCGSKVDRHEHIGQGSIGEQGLKRFVNHPAFKSVPLILETPKKSEDDDARNLSLVKSWLE